MEFLKIFLQYVLPVIVSGLISFWVANKQSEEKTKQVIEDSKVRLKEIETSSKTELEKIERQSQSELEKMREEYEIQKEQQMNNDVMALLKGDFDLSSMDKTLSDLANISEKLGLDNDLNKN